VHVDILYPIGFLLAVFGAILIVQGVVVGASVLGLNVNLYWGVVMAGSGAAALYVARRDKGSGRRT
jgi:membrane protein implicated in regulation of membrane protease activity